MRVYWANREGNPAPPDCRFHWLPFSASPAALTQIERVDRLPPPGAPIQIVRRTFSPEKSEWIENIGKALSAIRLRHLEKVVLARSCKLELKERPDPFAIAAALKNKAEGACVFCIESEDSAFLGCTPERLFAREGEKIVSEAVAGTRRRGKDPSEDERLKTELIESLKDLRELTPVQAHLRRALSPICKQDLLFSPISVHQTQNVQHLYSRCSGQLKKGVSDEEILMRLHPTPALCGTPKEKALSMIEELEPFERGLYGGAIGWTSESASEWFVAIRSCVIQGNTATLFTGTGIVEGSDPEEEWEELNQKLKLYEGIFV